MALASGIQDNIADQNNELNTVTAMGSILSQNPVDSTLFGAAQSSLMGFVTKGIAIRQNNQKIAPAGNPAIPGLATVAMAQMAELNLTMSLGSGGVNVARDNATVTMLKGDFAGGIVQNMKNLAAVSCPLQTRVFVFRTTETDLNIGNGELYTTSGVRDRGCRKALDFEEAGREYLGYWISPSTIMKFNLNDVFVYDIEFEVRLKWH
jgi:hypothetical protein